MHGGRVWLIPQVLESGAWTPIKKRLGNTLHTVEFVIDNEADAARAMEKALAAIEAHKNCCVAEEAVVRPEADGCDE